MRLFLAVDVDETLRRDVARLAADVRAEMDTSSPGLAETVKWTHPRDMHLTLHFLGDVGPADATRLREALANPFPIAPFTCELGGLGVFPPAGPVRVLWLGTRQGAAELTVLHRLAGERIAGLPFERDRRGFHAHLTLGRFRQSVRQDVRGLIRAMAGGSVGTSLVSHVTLYESHLSSSGPAYEVLTRTSLEP